MGTLPERVQLPRGIAEADGGRLLVASTFGHSLDLYDASGRCVELSKETELAGVKTQLQLVYVATFQDALDYLEGASGGG